MEFWYFLFQFFRAIIPSLFSRSDKTPKFDKFSIWSFFFHFNSFDPKDKIAEFQSKNVVYFLSNYLKELNKSLVSVFLCFHEVTKSNIGTRLKETIYIILSWVGVFTYAYERCCTWTPACLLKCNEM